MHSGVGDSSATESHSGITGSAADDLEDILDDPHCRYLLAYLREAEGTVNEETLARHVVAQITNTRPESVGDDVQRRVQTWLHHGQLPVLDEYGVVEFDAASGEVILGPEADL